MEENIEIRSEKVRNIIGKMPSILIRYGIGIIASVLFLIIVGSFFFKFTPSYEVRAQVFINNSDTSIRLEVPQKMASLINVGTPAFVSFDNLNINEQQKISVSVNQIESMMHVGKEGAYFYAYCNIIDCHFIDKQIETDGFVSAKAQIFDNETSLFDYVISKMFVR